MMRKIRTQTTGILVWFKSIFQRMIRRMNKDKWARNRRNERKKNL